MTEQLPFITRTIKRKDPMTNIIEEDTLCVQGESLKEVRKNFDDLWNPK